MFIYIGSTKAFTRAEYLVFVFIYNNNNNDEDVIVYRGVSLDVDIFGDNLEELSVSSTTALPVNRTSMTNSLKQIVKQKRFY
ncbi:unnamed protein product [Rotaria sp. Silwood1]|nr:unnamed protein product [Rotaria sp. Silwood1]